ncbi:MAG: membrane protein insertase YidC [Akkermansia sp.]|nr:membrane protein insertase YidC [Akkermansia sp.]
MDRTAWIVVTICVVLLGLQWTMNEPQEQPADQPAATAPADPAQQAASPVQPAEPAAQPATPVDGAAAPVAQPAAPATDAPAAAKPAQEIAVLEGKDAEGNVVARYHFRDVGGSISGVEMVGKAINSTKPELQQNVSINSDPDHGIGTLMFGLAEDRPATFDTAAYRVVAQDEGSITLVAQVGELVIRKIYTLKPLQQGEQRIDGNAYAFDLKIDVQNTSAQSMEARNWGLYAGGACQISTDEPDRYSYYVTQDNGDFNKESAGSFSGMFSGTKARICTSDFKALEWAGVMNQYYASIIQPAKDSGNGGIYAAPANFKLPVTGETSTNGVQLAVCLPDFTLSPKTAEMQGGQKNLSYSVFTGPKLNLMLSDMNGEFRKLDRLMDYGILTFLSYPMNWLINLFYGWFGNWGWAIVAMTFVVRGIIWPLYRKSYMSMKRMSLLQPKMKELKEKYPDDQQKVQMEMMKLYQEYGISPMGGCLPMLLQMPIFFAFFWVLLSAAEFRGAEWVGWVSDLSQMDTVCWIPVFGYNLPLNVLPILMAASMIIQMHMTPATGDATQVKIMRWMPALFFLFCYTYASALALYWTTTNIISIIQTILIRRLPQPELTKVKHKAGAKKGFMQRMMEAQQQALKEQQRQARK